ncbi:MAG: RNA polymerase factor sigma-54 [Alphaproteobacteria bacterium]|nr:RNA polymerase factor sigma-54 [Alphaproteobacteria bacterium]
MTFTQRLDQRQTQTLVMTPQLQQAIKLLQMSNLELSDFVAQEIEQNPLLEQAGDDDFGAAADRAAEMAAPQSVADPAPLSGDMANDTGNAEPDHFTEDGLASDGYDSTDRFAGTSRSGSFDGDDFSLAESVAEKPSLRAHLLQQIHVDFADPVDRIIAASLVEMLDESGYLPADLDLVRAQLGVDAGRFDGVIARLQRLDPCGIFARSLHECLALQLHERNRLDPAMGLLLQNLDLLAKRENAALMRICNVDAEDLAGMIAEIRSLNPKPAAGFAADVAPPIAPDVMLRPQPGKEGGWHVELNTDNLPRVLANERYYTRIQATAAKKADKDYIADRWQQANWLVKALHQRATTILKVAAEIVRQQDAFFMNGVAHLKPLILKDIADLVGMHESTVSRVTQHKYISTPRGMFELKYFFTTAIARSDGGADMSSESVRARIRALIDNEKPAAILSDDHISMMLRGEGIDVARRTVAKYREAMRIPTSAQRRRDKRLPR